MRLARSALYVPGDVPDKLRSAIDRGADELIVDLEDAVLPERKDLARDIVVAGWTDCLPPTSGCGCGSIQARRGWSTSARSAAQQG
ncbi:aldolase/citrate lyase family protein [Aeromicrobium sp. UC242_57]